MQFFVIRSGASDLRVRLPPGWPAEVAAPSAHIRPPDRCVSLARAMARPYGGKSLLQLARGARSALLAHTDASRSCPDAELLGAAAAQLEAAGVRDIRLLCGLGAHRALSPEERRAKLGPLAERYPATDHDCADPAGLADLGPGPYGVPLQVSRLAAEADLVVSTGVVEPHQYAGYSGGAKTVAIGAGGEATITATHSPAMIERPDCGPGLLAGNPLQEVIWESARRSGLSFIINVVRRPGGWAYFAGAPRPTHRAAAAFAARLFEVPVGREPFEAAVCGVPHPKSASLYQASRAASYLGLSPRGVLAPGAAIIVACTLEEGAGGGPGARRFCEAMQACAGRPEVLLAVLRQRPLRPGEQRAFVMALVSSRYRVVVVSGQPEVVSRAGLEAAASVEEALEAVAARLGRPPRLLVLPEAVSTLPYPAP